MPRPDRHPDIPAHSGQVLDFIDPSNSATPRSIEAVHLETHSDLEETVSPQAIEYMHSTIVH